MSDLSDAPPRKTVYRSAIDLWIVALLLLTPLVSVVLAIILTNQGRGNDAMTLLLVGGGAALVTFMVAIPCRYTVLEDTISIRSGLICYKVALDEITSVEKSSSILSGPALSLKRVAIKTHKKTYLVSPKQRDDFISHLSDICDLRS